MSLAFAKSHCRIAAAANVPAVKNLAMTAASLYVKPLPPSAEDLCNLLHFTNLGCSNPLDTIVEEEEQAASTLLTMMDDPVEWPRFTLKMNMTVPLPVEAKARGADADATARKKRATASSRSRLDAFASTGPVTTDFYYDGAAVDADGYLLDMMSDLEDDAVAAEPDSTWGRLSSKKKKRKATPAQAARTKRRGA